MSPSDIAVRMTHIAKAYGACVANHDVDLEVRRGEVHALVGENGAGKSTLMQILSGLVRPDSGTVEVLGRDVTGWTTAQAIAAKVGMVHQHFMLVPTLTVLENLVLGREPTKGGRLDLEKARAQLDTLSKETGLDVPPDALVSSLSVGRAQRVEVLKALYRGAELLILDEPTAVLSPPEVTELLAVLARLKAAGTTVILITHKLPEVLRASDRITVMRRGKTVATLETASTSASELAEKMVGRSVDLEGEARRSTSGAPAKGPTRLSASHLVVRGAAGTRAVDDVSFELRAGEILGIAGVEGNGQTELVLALAGLLRPEAGSLRMGGTDITRASVAARKARGLSHVPEDRQGRGLVLDYSIEDNLILGHERAFTRSIWLDRGRMRAFAERAIDEHDIRPRDPTLPVRALSGGNQQKIVIAREMGHGFEVLIAAQPTRGVDVGAIEAIHARLRAARDAGKAILLVSAELSEVLSLADRVAVLFRGRIAVELSGGEATPELVGPYMIGAATAKGAA